MRTEIVIATSNHLLMLQHSLSNLLEATPGDDWKLTVIDDASTDGTSEWLASFKPHVPFRHIRLEAPHICGIFGKGLAQVKPDSEFMVIMDDDVVFRPYHWLDITLEYWHNFPNLGVALLLDHGYYEFFRKLYGEWPNIYRDLGGNFGHGFCQVVRTEDYLKSGGFRQDAGRYAQDAHFQSAVHSATGKPVYGFWRPMLVHLGAAKDFYYGYKPLRAPGEAFV